jgi:hypothetical protein
MGRPTMFLLCLIAALSGTPLRQAEAAGDFARTRAELGQDHVETIDGGVGDDAELAVLEDGSHASAYQAMMPLAAAEGLLPPLLPSISSSGLGPRCPSGPAATLPPPGSGHRHAWLQCFLF